MYKVLLAEDEEWILQGIHNIIDWEALGLKIVHMVHDGNEALECIEKEPVDIIVTDINMPGMDGLTMLKLIREKSEKVHFIILSGYDDFQYAQTAIRLGVEGYILKPIDETELEQLLKDTIKKIEEEEKKSYEYLEENQNLFHYLKGETGENIELLQQYGITMEHPFGTAAHVKMKQKNLEDEKLAEIVSFLNKGYQGVKLHPFCFTQGEIFLFIFLDFNDTNLTMSYFSSLQNELEALFEVFTFFTISNPFTDLQGLRSAYKETKRMQKYLIIEGYGTIIEPKALEGRITKDITLNNENLRKMVLSKKKEEVFSYLENLFINTVKEEQITTDVVYRLAIKLAIALQDIIDEFKLEKNGQIKNLTELVDELYRAEDLSVIKNMFFMETIEIMDCLHTEDSHYTPVIRQIMSEIDKNYKEDMNLKTLSYKYNMNASYLGQIFQKEVGCSFSQYLSKVKNGKARELILNTNMKINDIAKEVGYPDTSYFYRKFKQCYGTSPASLREMKKW